MYSANAIAAHCRSRSCERQRATSHPSKESKMKIECSSKRGVPVGNIRYDRISSYVGDDGISLYVMSNQKMKNKWESTTHI